MRQQPAEGAASEVIIIDLKKNNEVMKRPIKADSAIMHWHKQVIALKAQQRTLQIFDLGQKLKLKSSQMTEDVQFWRWISIDSLALVTDTAVFHWNVFDGIVSNPGKIFDRNSNIQVGRRFSLVLHRADQL